MLILIIKINNHWELKTRFDPTASAYETDDADTRIIFLKVIEEYHKTIHLPVLE